MQPKPRRHDLLTIINQTAKNMYSTIIEIRDHKVPMDQWATESNFEDNGDMMDYCDLSNEQERTEVIERFLENFKDLFTKGNEPNSVVYTGKIAEVRDKWVESIESEFGKFKSSGKCDSFKLLRAIHRPFGIYTLFCMPDWSGPWAEYPKELFELLETMKEGDILYIGSTFDYHW